MSYAKRYTECGYKSAFYNEITSIHIGRLTSERNSVIKNAYELNNIRQFGTELDYHYIWLTSNNEQNSLYHTHIQNIPRTYYVLEIIQELLTVVNINQIDIKPISILWLHMNIWNLFLQHTHWNTLIISNTEVSMEKMKEKNTSNLDGYIITRQEATDFLEKIKNEGVFGKSLYDFGISSSIAVFSFFSISPCGIYLYLPQKDHFGDDIEYQHGKSVQEYINYANTFDMCIGFNTLGYFKDHININTLIDLKIGKPEDGLYIHMDRYRNKYYIDHKEK
jgi:hypothetical protein